MISEAKRMRQDQYVDLRVTEDQKNASRWCGAALGVEEVPAEIAIDQEHTCAAVSGLTADHHPP